MADIKKELNSKVPFLDFWIRFIKHPLFTGSSVMIFGNLAVNSVNYFYHLILGRILGPSNYGVLVSTISLAGLLSVVPTSFGLVIVRFVSRSKNKEEVKIFVKWLERNILIGGVIFFIVIFFLSPLFSSFLKINDTRTLLLVAPIFFMSLFLFFTRSVLQGLLKFGENVLSLLVEMLLKFFLGVLLALLKLSVFWVLSSIVVGEVISFIYTRLVLREYFSKSVEKMFNIRPLVVYSLPVVIQGVAMTSLLSSDLLLVKHFFPSHSAGIYSSVSTLAKIIFYASSPIASVMFPIVSLRHSQQKGYKKIFLAALFATLLVSFVLLVFYALFPSLSIKILYGKTYLEGAPLLFWFSLFMTFFTLSSVFISYNLSLGKTKVVLFPVLAAILQIIGIWFYHADLSSVVFVSLTTQILMLIALVLYFFYEKE